RPLEWDGSATGLAFQGSPRTVGQWLERRSVMASGSTAPGTLSVRIPTRQATARAGVPNGIRTRVTNVKRWCPRPLDDGDEASGAAAKRLHVAAQTLEIKQLAGRCALAAIEGDAVRHDGRQRGGSARRPWPRPRSVGQVFFDCRQQLVEGDPATDAI